MTKKRDTDTQAEADRIVWRCVSYGQLEAAAGITDREAFWKGKTEEQARAELRRLILDRVRRGERIC